MGLGYISARHLHFAYQSNLVPNARLFPRSARENPGNEVGSINTGFIFERHHMSEMHTRYLSVCLSVCVFWLTACLSVCLSTHSPISFVRSSICMCFSDCLFIRWSASPPEGISVQLPAVWLYRIIYDFQLIFTESAGRRQIPTYIFIFRTINR